MIKIDEQFSIVQYKSGWELHNTVPDKITTNVSYHGSLRLVAMAIVDKSCGHCADGTALLMCIMGSTEKICSVLGAIKK